MKKWQTRRAYGVGRGEPRHARAITRCRRAHSVLTCASWPWSRPMPMYYGAVDGLTHLPGCRADFGVTRTRRRSSSATPGPTRRSWFSAPHSRPGPRGRAPALPDGLHLERPGRSRRRPAPKGLRRGSREGRLRHGASRHRPRGAGGVRARAHALPNLEVQGIYTHFATALERELTLRPQATLALPARRRGRWRIPGWAGP